MDFVDYKIGEVLIDKDTIMAKVKELAADIRRDYAGKRLVCVCVLKGAAVFLSDLIREIGSDVDVRIDFMAVSSYGDSTETSGVVKIQKDLSLDIAGEDVLIVEDILDSGVSLTRIKELLSSRGPKSLEICVLLDKKERYVMPVSVRYLGFEIPNAFVVGYGLDYAEKYRHLSSIHIAVPV